MVPIRPDLVVSSAFRRRQILNLNGTETTLVLGCKAGFSFLFLAEDWRKISILGVDSSNFLFFSSFLRVGPDSGEDWRIFSGSTRRYGLGPELEPGVKPVLRLCEVEWSLTGWRISPHSDFILPRQFEFINQDKQNNSKRMTKKSIKNKHCCLLIDISKPNQTKPNQTKPNQTKSNQIKPNQIKSNQTKPIQIKSN